MEELTGYVEHIVFRNAENGYTVMNFAGEEDEMTCVGTFSVISEGMYLKIAGRVCGSSDLWGTDESGIL